MTYTVSAIKTTRGHEGHGFNANLLCDGKKVAFVFDDASGGPVAYEWADHKCEATVTCRTDDGELHAYKGTPEEAKFQAFILTLPKMPADEKNGCPEMFTNNDIYVSDLVNAVFDLKKVVADLKKSVTVKAGDKILCWKLSERNTLAAITAHVHAKYPGAVIVNEMNPEAAFDFFKANNLI